MGRTITDFERVYINGYPLSAYFSSTGERGVSFELHKGQPCLLDAIAGAILGKPSVTLGPFVGVFDNTASLGSHAVLSGATGTRKNVTVEIGDQAAPVMGCDTFNLQAVQEFYNVTTGGELVGVNVGFFGPDFTASLNYSKFWGKLLHPYGAETAANTANTNVDNNAATTAGGYMMYHVYPATLGGGSIDISVDDSANGTTWAALSGATISIGGTPTSGVIQLATTATVRRYLRWQATFNGGASSATFLLSFVRG
jgi:hypothetical protein